MVLNVLTETRNPSDEDRMFFTPMTLSLFSRHPILGVPHGWTLDQDFSSQADALNHTAAHMSVMCGLGSVLLASAGRPGRLGGTNG